MTFPLLVLHRGHLLFTSLLMAAVLSPISGLPRPAFGGDTSEIDPPPRETPNVILIFIDDMGYGDVGFNGASGPRTPHLDEMARNGMRFTDFYVGCPVCSGSRTALMTGTHYQRLNMDAVLFPHSKEGLHPDEVTIAEMLRAIGYRTTCIIYC